MRGTAARMVGSAAATVARPARRNRRPAYLSSIAAATSAPDVTPARDGPPRLCSIVIAPDSMSQRRSAGMSASVDSSSTQPPASSSGATASERRGRFPWAARRRSVRGRRRTRCAAFARARPRASAVPLRRHRRESAPARQAAAAYAGETRRVREKCRESRLAFQCARFRWGLLGCLFRLDGEIRGQPVGDAALERDRAVALTDQLRGDVRARELVGI